MKDSPVTIFWFRRDLRVSDNHGLSQALQAGAPILPLFIFDDHILRHLERDDARVSYLHRRIGELDEELRARGHRLYVFQGKPTDVFKKLKAEHNISQVFANEDYEPDAIARDAAVGKILPLSLHKDHLIFARADVVKDDGTPYRVFTPYSKRWLETLAANPPKTFATPLEKAAPYKFSHANPSLKDIGFTPSKIPVPDLHVEAATIKHYLDRRDFMALDATTKVGLRLRFGEMSVREALKLAQKHSPTWLKELIWREFFAAILTWFPHTVDQPYDEKFAKFPWRDSQSDFKKWQAGMTGYPIVDAGMRELNATGFMHNRARMITGSFLCKHLLLPWKWGERDFAAKLFDFDLTSNVGNWQWVSGCGVDAAPYFRIFNPALQTKKFDRDHEYIKRWVPEVGGKDYPDPMVDHDYARRRALGAYGKIRKAKS